MSGGLPFYAPMPASQPQGGYPQGSYAPTGYVQNSGRPAVPARAGGIPVLPTAVARGARGEETRPSTAPVARSVAEPQAAAAPRAAAPLPTLTASRTVTIPTPEEVGVNATATAARAPVALDWAATHRQLNELGAERFEMAKLPTGGSRFSCWLRDGTGLRPIVANGASDAEAVRLCLAQARTR